MMKFDGQQFSQAQRVLPEERAVALSVGGSTHAVMMASPRDLEDFAYGFLFTDGVIVGPDDIDTIEILEAGLGLDVQTRLIPAKSENYRASRRAMVGPVGCGLCGIESLELAVPNLPRVVAHSIPDDLPWQALQTLQSAQERRRSSGAMHGAALLDQDGQLIHAREDIGRHNAMDKVIGAALREGISMEDKIMVVSSRVSLDLVVKTVRARIGTLIARATPSDLAFSQAEKCRLQLVAPVFDDAYYSNQQGSGVQHEQ